MKLKIKKRTAYLLGVIILFLSILKINNFLPAWFGYFLFFSYNFYLLYFIQLILKKYEKSYYKFLSIIFLSSYYIVSLSIVYYLFGLNKQILTIWLIINLILINLIIKYYKVISDIEFEYRFEKIKNFSLYQSFDIIILFITFYFFYYFFTNPVLNGWPTPWPNAIWSGFFIFLLLSFLLIIKNFFYSRSSDFINILYFLLTICVIAFKYVYSYGYDTLIHQASLDFIEKNGQILPLTPFYIGQYSLEILIKYFTNLDFVFIERWLVPILFVFLVYYTGKIFLEKMNNSNNSVIIPISILLILPAVYTYTTPFSCASIWGIVSVIFLFLYFNNKNNVYYLASFVSAISSVLIHPFVGLNVLVWVIGVKIIEKDLKIYKLKLIFLFIFATLSVLVGFIIYYFINSKNLFIYNPLSYYNYFINLFSDPIYYLINNFFFWSGPAYLYERLNYLLFPVGMLIFFPLSFKRKELSNGALLSWIGLSCFLSAWLFISAFHIENYFYGDQINYTYRLLRVSRLVFWPLLMLLLVRLFIFIKNNKSKYLKIIFIVFFSIILTLSWYFTYPRKDIVSNTNISNIRQVDYSVVDFIYNKENGKNDYLVLANQIICAGAIKKYGFGPYYYYNNEEILYCSLPWGGKMSKIYNQIMDTDANADDGIKEIIKIANVNNVHKFYLIFSDAWMPTKKTLQILDKTSSESWSIDGQRTYYFKIN